MVELQQNFAGNGYMMRQIVDVTMTVVSHQSSVVSRSRQSAVAVESAVAIQLLVANGD